MDGPAEVTYPSTRVVITLHGEEAMEFKRYVGKRNGKKSVVGKNLLVKGLISVGSLPEWWERRRK